MRLKRLRLFLWQELIPGRAIVNNNKRVLGQVGGHSEVGVRVHGLVACHVVERVVEAPVLVVELCTCGCA